MKNTNTKTLDNIQNMINNKNRFKNREDNEMFNNNSMIAPPPILHT